LLREHAAERGTNRNLIKTIEKQKAARVERLKSLLAEDKKHDGLVFDELEVDHVFIDEAHDFKNLETPTKMDRVVSFRRECKLGPRPCRDERLDSEHRRNVGGAWQLR
jgi:N12 class adenine-specific DNA methylase